MLAIAYLGIILFILFIEITRKKKVVFDFLSFFHLMFCLMYPLPAFLMSANLGFDGDEYSGAFTFTIYDAQLLLAIFLGYFIILVGFYSASAQIYAKKTIVTWRSEKTILRIAIFMLLFSFISVQIYASQFGGLTSAISKATFIRTAVAEGGTLVFFKHFMFLSFCPSYLLAAFIFDNKIRKHKLFLYTAFVISAFSTVIGVTITGGRAHLIIYFLTFYLVKVIVSKKLPWLLTISLLLPSIIFILYGKAFFFSLSGIKDGFDSVREILVTSVETQSKDTDGFSSLIANFSYQIYSLKAAFNAEYPLRLFIDWYYGIIAFLPERLIEVDMPETLSTFNTRYIAGNNDFMIPTGMFAFGIYSLSWPGLIIVCFIYGWVGCFLENFFYHNLNKAAWMPFLYVMAAQIWIDFFTAGDPEIFLFADFGYLLSLFILFAAGSQISTHKFSKNSQKRMS
ncbi:O-antigen polymerase [Rivularia sp. UHCC 0363]|uniref:O-antigen polymerase n=1 Tax=Rivularia sp. UHCC 0363 TaxID=3110244 RepID=UPI002B2210BF|nr:O-antigen polymerase [Rivularia sp. UHCC 0363]MEA5597652.1 O-antigen polymerase [Rivularia sp. UHCC 0363]